MPFKLNQDRRHCIPRQRHKVTNWREYDASLPARGSTRIVIQETSQVEPALRLQAHEVKRSPVNRAVDERLPTALPLNGPVGLRVETAGIHPDKAGVARVDGEQPVQKSPIGDRVLDRWLHYCGDLPEAHRRRVGLVRSDEPVARTIFARCSSVARSSHRFSSTFSVSVGLLTSSSAYRLST